MITDDELGELKQLFAAAEPGPWLLDDDSEWIAAENSRDQGDVVCERPRDAVISVTHWPANAALIVAMHSALPKLIREVEAIRRAARRAND